MGELLDSLSRRGEKLVGFVAGGKVILLDPRPALGTLKAGMHVSEVFIGGLLGNLSKEELQKKVSEDYVSKREEVLSMEGYIFFGPHESIGTNTKVQPYAIYQKL